MREADARKKHNIELDAAKISSKSRLGNQRKQSSTATEAQKELVKWKAKQQHVQSAEKRERKKVAAKEKHSIDLADFHRQHDASQDEMKRL